MKRVRCPKCDNFITFDETKYQAGQSLVFVCPNCNKQFGIRMGVSKLHETRKEEKLDENANEKGYGSIVVIENVFAYKQVIPLQLGDNIIGRYMKNSGINCPIETVDPSVDMNHCVINVSRDKKGKLKYVLRDGPSSDLELSLIMRFWVTENAALSKTEPCSPSEQLLSFSAQQTVKKKTKKFRLSK